MAQVVEHLPSKHEAPSSIPSTDKLNLKNKVYNPVALSTFPVLCDDHHYLVPVLFQRSSWKPVPVSSHSLVPHPSPWQPPTCFLSLHFSILYILYK
jgi:hypothetical protein